MDTTTPFKIIESTNPIDCACLIHGNGYDWSYVEKLYNMLNRHITPGIRLHVYTEVDRKVPSPMIKHVLDDWGISGPRRSWWYKMQLFNKQHHAGPLLYFDLDTVIVRNIDWIWQKPPNYFWTLRDFKYLWEPTDHSLNSSVMWWNTTKFDFIWQKFKQLPLTHILQKYRGDQDYLQAEMVKNQVKFLSKEAIKSWRWETFDGGYEFSSKQHRNPGSGTKITDPVSVLIFHGKPKPSQINDIIIKQHWQ